MPSKQHNHKAVKASDSKSHDSKMARGHNDKPRKQHGPNHPATMGGPAVIIAVGKPSKSAKPVNALRGK